MKISVALCSYNGGRHIGEQLASIVRQHRLPDELIICDDGSRDETLEIIERCKSSAGFPVHTHVSTENLGSTKNFEQAVRLCRGDVIALSDQDDVWAPSKLSIIEQSLEENPRAGFVFSNAAMVGEDLSPLGYRLWDAVHFSARERRLFERGLATAVLVRFNVVTGATMAFRSRYRDDVLPIPPRWVHDGWMALVLSTLAPCAFVDQDLIQYRQHSGQQIGGRRHSFREKIAIARSQDERTLRGIADDYAEVLRHLERIHPKLTDERWIEALSEKVRHFRARAMMRGKPLRFPLILRELFGRRYGRCSLGWKSLAQDMLL